jgi:tetratricopeptide (TPR) repeat protein
VLAYALGREIGPRLHSSTELPFIGRDREVGLVAAALTAAGRGQGSVVTITGATGVGKTRLIDEVLTRAEAGTVLRFNAEQAGSTSPYRGLRDPMRQLLGIERSDNASMAVALRTVVRERAPQLLPLLPLVGDVVHVEVPSTADVDRIELRFRPERTADAVAELLVSVIAGPLALVFEDAQWMDSASCSFVEWMSALVPERPWLIVVARRPGPGGLHLDADERIELMPLSPSDTKAIVIAATAAAPLRPHEVDVIVERSTGSPLFLGEVLRLTRGGQVEDLPSSLDAVVNAEIDSLDALPRRLVRYASVLGRSFRTQVLRELLADDGLELDDSTTRQLGRFLEYEGADRVRFRQEMHREVAYQGLTYRRRRELHLKAAQITERAAGDSLDSVADLLARHYALANDYARAWRYGRRAGERARGRYANVEAALHFQLAIDAARRLGAGETEELVEVWRLLGDVREQLGLFELAIDAYRRGATLVTDDAVTIADLMWRRARARMFLGAYRTALGEATRGRRMLDSRQDQPAAAARARLIALQALLRQAQQRASLARRLAALAISEAQAAGDDTALARAYLVADWADRILGDTDGRGHGELALELYHRLGDLNGIAKASNNLGGISYFEGRWDDAVDWYRRALDAYRRSGNEAAAAVTASNLGELLVSRGALDEAEPMLRDAIRVLRASRELDGVVFAEIQLGRLLVERGAAAEAAEHLANVRGEALALGQVGHACEAAMHWAQALVGVGDFTAALQVLDDGRAGIGAADPVFQSTWERVAALALAGSGRTEEARAAIRRGLESARQQGLVYEECLLLNASVDLDRACGIEPARSVLDEIVQRFRGLNIDLSSGSADHWNFGSSCPNTCQVVTTSSP